MGKKIQVSFSDKQLALISELKGEFGDSESEVVRSIVVAWLAEKSFISTTVKKRMAGDPLSTLLHQKDINDC